MLKGKCIVVGVTGGIAAYKSCILVSQLKKRGVDVHVVMTKNAKEFVAPLTFESLSGNPVVSDMFNRETPWEIEHVSLAQKADLIVIAPATANIIGKIACGICDDMLSTTVMATRAQVMLAPAMNTGMYDNPAFTQNMEKLIKRGFKVVDSGVGRLACDDIGKGRMAEPEEILDRIEAFFADKKKDYKGVNVLITAGGTSQPIDGVRFMTNKSSGKMGLAIAERVMARGGKAIIVLGSHTANVPYGAEIIPVTTTEEMYNAVMSQYKACDVIIKAAAPCDYRPSNFSVEKIKGERISIDFVKNVDIAKAIGKIKENRFLTVFAAETSNLVENAKKKMLDKNADMVVANDVTTAGASFNVDTNVVTIIDKNGGTLSTEKLPKTEIADIILDEITKNRVLSHA